MKKETKKRSLIISGGGAKGAWGGGTIQGLYEKYDRNYDIVVGCSTGSLLMNLAGSKQMDRLKKLYTNVDQSSIFKWNPFTKKGKINVFKALWRIVTGKPTLGDSSNLHDLMRDSFSEKDFKDLKSSGVEIVATVVNLSKKELEFKSSNDYGYDDMMEWSYASASVPVFMSITYKDGFEYVDGGVIDHIPVQYAIDSDCDEIDIIVHRPEEQISDDFETSSVLELFDKVVNTMLKEVSANDVSMSKLQAKNKDIILNYYFTPYKLTKNSLMFDKEIMLGWWKLGYNNVMNGSYEKKSYVMTPTGKISKI